MQFVLILFFLLISQYTYSADISITVFEKGTGDPITEATVVLNKSQEYTETDEQGNAIFEDVNLPDMLKVLSQGYSSHLSLLKKESGNVEVYLEPINIDGELIVVTAERKSEKSSKTSLAAEEIIKVPGTGGDPLNVLSSLPGIVTVPNGFDGPPSAGFYVRGSGQNENSAWVNRTPIGYLYHFGGLYSTINPALLSDFNIFLGGFQVEYDDVLGGVLDVKLRAPQKNRLHQKYSIGTYESSLFLEGPIGKANGNHGFIFAARRSYIDLILSPETAISLIQNQNDDKPEEEKNEIIKLPVFHDIQAIWEYDSPIGIFRTSYFEASDSFEAIFNENIELDPQTAGDLGLTAGYRSLNFNWETSWGNSIFHSLPIVFSEDYTRLFFGTDNDGSPFFLRLKSKGLFIQPEVSILGSHGHVWTLGAQYISKQMPIESKITREPSEYDIGDNDFTTQRKFQTDSTFNLNTLAPYLKYTHAWSNKFKTTLGIRHTHTHASGDAKFDALLPRFNYDYEFYKDSWLTGAWGKYVQLPRASELSVDSGNPHLDYAKAEHRVLGLKLKRKNIWTYQIELFHKPMSNLVLPIDDNEPPGNYSNEGKGEAYGVDLLIKRDIKNGMTGWLSYSYIKATRTGKDNINRPFSGDQPHTFTLVWSQRLFRSWNKWTMGIRYQWHSGLPYDPIIDKKDVISEDDSSIRPIPIYPDIKNSERLPDFSQLDFRIQRKFLFNSWKMSVYLDIQNVLNEKNISGYDYADDIDNPKPVSNNMFLPAFGIEAEF